MVNFFERVLQHPQYYRQFTCGNSLITAFNCPMEARMMHTRFASMWTEYNYLFYVIDGEKVWHTAHGSYRIGKDSCVFVRKGGTILEQILDTGFCVILFFIPDEFISDTLHSKATPLLQYRDRHEHVMLLESNGTLQGFFLSMSGYFAETQEPDPSLLELKFRELVLNIAGNPANRELLCYFSSLLHQPKEILIKGVMEDNFCYNLKMDEYAALCNRSLSAFKRDFEKLYQSTPGKWLLEKRLQHAMHLIRNRHKTVSEAAFECGFESASHFSRAFKKRFGSGPAAMKTAGSPFSYPTETVYSKPPSFIDF